MNWMILIDPRSAAIVFGGTAVATLLRCGLGDCRVALARAVRLGRSGFDADQTRAELSGQIQDIHRDGLYRAAPHPVADCEFGEVTDALLHSRSLAALLARHKAHRARRLNQSERATRTFAQAAELAPVFGLAGTLISLSQLPADGLARGAFTGAIAMAVVTTLYGLLSANLVLAPLARMIERAALDEEAQRQQVIDWLADQVAGELPPVRSGRAA